MRRSGDIYKRISAIMIGILILALFTACGNEEEEPYKSPNFSKGNDNKTTETDASITDAEVLDAIMGASYTDATMSDATDTDAALASLSDALPLGLYEDNAYYNGLAEFKIRVDGEKWVLFDAVEVASATGATEDDINNLRYGYKSPYDEDTTYAAIASNTETGSTIIVTYINPDSYNMPEFSARDYLEMVASRYEDVNVSKVRFLGQEYEYMSIPRDEVYEYDRVLFAIDRDDMIILITFTLYGDTTLEEAVELMTPLYY